MVVEGMWPLFGCGVLGGLLVELLRWWKLRESETFPSYSRSPFYWLITLAMILAGGFISVLYGLEPRNALMAVNIGASAPAVIGALAVKPPNGVRLGGDSETQTRGFRENVESATGSVRSFLGFGT